MSFMDNDANVRSSGPNPVHPGGKKVGPYHLLLPSSFLHTHLFISLERPSHFKETKQLKVPNPSLPRHHSTTKSQTNTSPPLQVATTHPHTQHPAPSSSRSTTSSTSAEDLETHSRTQPLQHHSYLATQPQQYPAPPTTPPAAAEDLQTHRRTQPLHHPAPSSPSTAAEDLQTHQRTLPHGAMNVQPKGTSSGASSELLSGNARPAPSYVDPVLRDGAGAGRPKGKNLTEVGKGQAFEGGEGRNASFESEIGTEGDPGRLAERRMREGGGAGGLGERGKVREGEGRFGAVGEESA